MINSVFFLEKNKGSGAEDYVCNDHKNRMHLFEGNLRMVIDPFPRFVLQLYAPSRNSYFVIVFFTFNVSCSYEENIKVKNQFSNSLENGLSLSRLPFFPISKFLFQADQILRACQEIKLKTSKEHEKEEKVSRGHRT